MSVSRHLEDWPEGLAELHGTLLRDNRDRMTRHRSDPAKPHDRVRETATHR